MGRKKTKAETRSRDVSTDGADGLKHSPFAGLLGGAEPSDLPPGPRDAPEAGGETDATDGDASQPLAAQLLSAGKVVVSRERKGRGGKTVTRVRGLAPSSRPQTMARMKKALGCGATEEGDDVLLLGDVVDRAAAWLEDEGVRRVVRGSA